MDTYDGLKSPGSIAVNASGNIFTTSAGLHDHVVQKMGTDGLITNVAGTVNPFGYPPPESWRWLGHGMPAVEVVTDASGISVDDWGNLYWGVSWVGP